MKIHTGDVYHPKKKSKTEVLFVATPPLAYRDYKTLDESDVSNFPLVSSKFFPVIDQF